MDNETRDKTVIGNLGSPKLPFDYMQREYGTVPLNDEHAPFQWLSEVAYKNVHRIVARGYDTTELMEQGYPRPAPPPLAPLPPTPPGTQTTSTSAVSSPGLLRVCSTDPSAYMQSPTSSRSRSSPYS